MVNDPIVIFISMKYYVYELKNSLNNSTFYVGKGSGRRMYVHEFRAKRDHIEVNENRKLRNKIKSIWSSGGNVLYDQVYFTDDAQDAYQYESQRIMDIGLENLCNRFIFPPTSDEIYNLISMRNKGHITSEETKEKIRKTLMGHSVSKETRKKISESQRGRKRPCSQSRKEKIALAKRPLNGYKEVVSPAGQRYSIGILSDFCREHNLHLPGMCGVLKGYAKSHRGWRVVS